MTYHIAIFSVPEGETPHETLTNYLNQEAQRNWHCVQYTWLPQAQEYREVPKVAGNPTGPTCIVPVDLPLRCEVLLARGD